MLCSPNFVKSLRHITSSSLNKNMFVVGISWRVIWILVEKHVVFILSRLATIKRKQYRKCNASKILRLFTLFYFTCTISRWFGSQNVAFTAVFRRFWMRYSEPTTRAFLNFPPVLEVFGQLQTSLVVLELSLIHIWRCRRYSLCRSRWSPYH